MTLERAFEYPTDLRLILGVCLGVLPLYKLCWRRSRGWPPGPPSLPILGNLLDFRGQPPAFVKMAEWAEQYGDIISVNIGMAPYIILSSLDSVREAFLQKGTEFAGRPQTFSGDVFSDSGKDIILADYGPLWQVQRKIAHDAIRKYASGHHLEERVHRAVESLAKLLEKTKGPLDPMEYITLTIYNFILMTICGKHYERDDPEFQKLFKNAQETNDLFGSGLPHDYFPALRYLPDKLFPSLKNFRELEDVAYEFIEELVSEKRKSYDPAGTDTSRFSRVWAVSLIAGHSDVQKKLQEENDVQIGDRPVVLSDKDRLPYAYAVLHEVLRIRPINALALPHKTLRDTSVGGYKLPKGTHVMPNFWALHMNCQEWDEPHKFKPERWIEADGKFFAPSRSFLPFSTGKRVCVGESLAKAQLFMFISTLFQRFIFAPPPGETLKHDMQEIAFRPTPVSYKVVAKTRK